MARIRTVKPEFFTSEDVVCLSPLARLLYIGLWCEADREGRFCWRPGSFRLRYLPTDGCDIQAVAEELTARRLVVLYGDGLAYIPSFSKHQHVNPREAKSELPEPEAELAAGSGRRGSDASLRERDASTPPRVTDASLRVSDAQGGREGRDGKEHTPRVRDVSSSVVPFDPEYGAMPSQRRPKHCAWEATRRGLSVPQFLHEELLSKMARPDEAALLQWYAATEAAFAGRDVGEDALAFWRKRFLEWRGPAAVTPSATLPTREEALAEQRRLAAEQAAVQAERAVAAGVAP